MKRQLRRKEREKWEREVPRGSLLECRDRRHRKGKGIKVGPSYRTLHS